MSAIKVIFDDETEICATCYSTLTAEDREEFLMGATEVYSKDTEPGDSCFWCGAVSDGNSWNDEVKPR
jgi:hypothetical protein